VSRRALSFALLAGLCVADRARAEEPASAPLEEAPATLPAAPAGILERLSSPVSEAQAAEAANYAREGSDAAIAVAEALGEAGGFAAAETVADLLSGTRDRSVRLAALRAAGRIGLRTPTLARRVREALESARSDEERRAVAEALGRVGDGADVPALLDLARSEDVGVRSAAFRSLRELSGKAAPDIAVRWTAWWRDLSARVEVDVRRAIDGLESDPDGPEAEIYRGVLRQHGWASVGILRDATRRWFGSASADLRADACRLAAVHRLADCAGAAERVYDLAMDPALRADAATALAVLGVVPEAR
jgi:hypothetical protein